MKIDNLIDLIKDNLDVKDKVESVYLRNKDKDKVENKVLVVLLIQNITLIYFK